MEMDHRDNCAPACPDTVFPVEKEKELEAMETIKLSWFDAHWRNTLFTGCRNHLYQLKQFLLPRDEVFSWWAVTGVAGMGKTRLAIEATHLEEFRNADVRWLKRFDDYRESELKGSVDDILQSGNFRNIIIADDAQIYMDKIGILIEYIYGKRALEIGDHKIRLLLLVRMGEDENLSDTYKQLASKAAPSTLKKTRFNKFGSELRLEKYREDDVAEIVRSYAVTTAKKRDNKTLSEEQLSDMQKKAVEILKSEKVDPHHLRALFAMFITDALLTGKEPMSWDRIDILEYAVGEREDELLMWATRNVRDKISGSIYDMVRGIVSLSIIREGIELSELDGISKDLEKELELAGISLKGFLKEIQLFGSDGFIRVHMPDILAEYYVMRTLVIEPKDDDEVVRWVIRRLVKNMEGVAEFREKVRQDFRYIYNDSVNEYETIEDKLDDFYYAFFEQCSRDVAFDTVKKLLDPLDLWDSNAIILHETIRNIARDAACSIAVASILLKPFLKNESEIEDKRKCLGELRRLSEANAGNEVIANAYSVGLVRMFVAEPGIEEERTYLRELRRLSEANVENVVIAVSYSFGLDRMIVAEPGIEDKRKCLGELRSLSVANAGHAELSLRYINGLASMIAYEPSIEEKRKCLGELRRQSEAYGGNTKIANAYGKGLYNMINAEPGIKEKRKCLGELRSLLETNAGNSEIARTYCVGLVSMYSAGLDIEEKRKCLGELRSLSEANTGDVIITQAYSIWLAGMILAETGIEEKRKCLGELRSLSEANAGNEQLALWYCRVLLEMQNYDNECYDDYTAELYRLLSDKEFARYVAKNDSDIITDTRRKFLDYEQRMGIVGNIKVDWQ